jgi:hypothetical protein
MGDRVEARLFDLGRVIFELDSARVHVRWAQLAGVPVAEIERRYQLRVVRSTPFYRHERGEISDEEFFDQ